MENIAGGNIRATFICLANSRKKSGRCLAGKASYQGAYTKWIRPISAREHEELKGNEFHIHTGEEAKLLDLLEVKLLSHQPKLHQQENFLMDVSVPLRKIGTINIEDLARLADTPIDLWGVGHSSRNGLNDFVPKGEIENHTNSLFLIYLRNLMVLVTEEWSASWHRNQKVFRAEFNVEGNSYKLKITDPLFEEKFFDKPVGSYEIQETLLTISLGEEFNNSYWKLVAGVMPLTYGEKWSS
jgi:hypothetical protein